MSAEITDVRMYVWAHSALQLIRRSRSELHRHAAVQLTLGLEGPLRMGDGGSEEVHGRAILVATNQAHWFESDGWAAVLWMESESRVGRLFEESFLDRSPLVPLPEEPVRNVWPALLELTAPRATASSALRARQALEHAWLGDEARGRPLHPALRRALHHIHGLSDPRVPAAELAKIAGVSESHLMHLFGDDLGVPLRRYLLWQRTKNAIRSILDGANATKAAHDAGFHDLPHLTRVFKKLMAVTPSELAELRTRGHFELCEEP